MTCSPLDARVSRLSSRNNNSVKIALIVGALTLMHCPEHWAVADDIKMCNALDLPEVSELPVNNDLLKLTAQTVHGNDRLWRNIPNNQLRVRFVDGLRFQHDLVRRFAPEWSDFCSINFKFVDSGEAEIRVSFKDIGSNSRIGSDALKIPQNEATMNFGWLTLGVSDSEAKRVILHEFGHALGMMHEHARPDNGIPWDEDAVILHYAEKGWCEEKTRHNVLEVFDGNIANGSSKSPDRKSIMHYAINPKLTKGRLAVEWNMELSEVDKQTIYGFYPKRPLIANTQDLTLQDGVPLNGQRWLVHKFKGQEFVALENVRSRQVLDFDSGKPNLSVRLLPLLLQDGLPLSGQRWLMREIPNDKGYFLENVRAQRVLDYDGENACYLETLPKEGPLSGQIWYFEPVSYDGSVYIQNSRSKMVLDWTR